MKKLSTAALALTLACSMPAPVMTASAQSTVSALAKNFEAATDVPLNKKWTISLNKAVNKNVNLQNFVYVEDSEKNKVNVNVSLDSTGKKIYVEPVSEYKANKTYELIIDQGLTSEKGKTLKETVVKKFTTVNRDALSFEQSYTLTNTTEEVQYATLSKGAYYQVVPEHTYEGIWVEGYNTPKTTTVELYPGETLYCDFESKGTIQSPNLTKELKQVATPYFKSIELAPAASLAFKAKLEDVTTNIMALTDEHQQVIYNAYSSPTYDREELGYLTDTNSQKIKAWGDTLVENLGATNVTILVPQKYISVEPSTKHIDLKTLDVKPNETVQISATDLNAVNLEAAILHAMPNEDPTMWMQYEFTHTYMSDSEQYGVNYWNFTETVNNKKDAEMYYYWFGHDIFADSKFLLKNTGTSTIHLYGKHIQFEKTNRAIHQTYVLQPHEKVKVSTTVLGDHDYFYIKDTKDNLSMNVYLEMEERIEYMGEMQTTDEKLKLPIYDETIIENTSDQPIEMYGNAATISYKNVTTQALPYEKVIVGVEDRYKIKNLSNKETTYFVGRTNDNDAYYLDGYEQEYFGEVEIEYTKRKLERDYNYDEYGYSNGFYQRAKDKIYINPNEQRYIENSGNNPVVMYIPNKGLTYSKEIR